MGDDGNGLLTDAPRAPPVAPALARHEEFARAIMLRATVGMSLASLGGLAVRFLAGSKPDAGTVVGLVVLSVCVASALLVKTGRTRAGTIVFLTLGWILVAGISLARGPSYPATIPLYLLITLLAGLLLSLRAVTVVALLSSVATTTIIIVQSKGYLPEPQPIGLAYKATSGVVAFLVVVAAFTAALRRLRGALSELEHKNRELEKVRGELEATVEARTRSLVDAREAAESASRAKSVFLANMSHELRTPMNAVLGMTDVLLASPVPGEQRGMLKTIREGGDALLSVLNDVLDLSAVEQGRIVVEREAYEPRTIAFDVVALMQPEAQRAGIGLHVEVDEAVPPRTLGDGRRVRQILLNLVGNAVKFTERGEVRVKLGAEGGRLRFRVVDTGVGIAPVDMRRIFEPFTQIDASPTRRRGGTGLGLAISRELATRMGGQLDVESTPGRGCMFTLALPLADVEQGAIPSRAPLPTIQPGLRILVAEDNEVNVRVLLHMLRHLGLRADVVSTGAAALAAVRSRTYDCVLMDVHMPEMDGLEATRRIRAEHNGLVGPVVIAVTADALPEQRTAVKAAGVDEVLSKPVLIEALAGALARADEQITARQKTGEPA